MFARATQQDRSMSGTYALVHKIPPRLTLAYLSLCSGWLANTFVNIDNAENDLCADRSGFLRTGRVELIPPHIQKHIIHGAATAHIEGFRQLFDHLNMEPTADDLRQLVVDYFNSHRYLQPHLHEHLSTLSVILLHRRHT